MQSLPTRALTVLSSSLALVGCCCSGPELHHATLEDASGLVQGSPVMVSGVEVGHVRSVHVDGSAVDVEFAFQPEQHVVLRESACGLALARGADDEAVLVVIAGDGEPLPPEQAIPECHIAADAVAAFVTSLGEAFSATRDAIVTYLQELARSSGAPAPMRPGAPTSPSLPTLPGAASGGATAGGPTSDLPPTPLPRPEASRSVCDSLSITVERIEPVGATALFLPNGGSRIHFAITNDNAVEVTLPSFDRVSFLDRDHRVMTIAQVPGDGWFMPVPLPAHATTPITVVMSSDASTLGEMTIAGITAADPFDGCTVHQTFTP